jgi:putative ABC transport system substrate-binding protein
MDRRRLLIGIGTLIALPLSADAQQGVKVPRIGYISPNSAAANLPSRTPFREALREHGFVEGDTINVEWRFGDGDVKRVPALVAELVKLKVDLIVATNTQAAIPRALPQRSQSSLPLSLILWPVDS